MLYQEIFTLNLVICWKLQLKSTEFWIKRSIFLRTTCLFEFFLFVLKTQALFFGYEIAKKIWLVFLTKYWVQYLLFIYCYIPLKLINLKFLNSGGIQPAPTTFNASCITSNYWSSDSSFFSTFPPNLRNSVPVDLSGLIQTIQLPIKFRELTTRTIF